MDTDTIFLESVSEMWGATKDLRYLYALREAGMETDAVYLYRKEYPDPNEEKETVAEAMDDNSDNEVHSNGNYPPDMDYSLLR